MAYQHGQGPMFLDTLWVKKKVKFAWPRAGLEIPSIFCSTHGPRSVLAVVAPALIVCHGHANLMLGRRMFRPTRCRPADSPIRTTDAIARRNIRHPATKAAIRMARGEIRRRFGLEPPPGQAGLSGHCWPPAW